MFKSLMSLLEIGLTRNPIKVYWEAEDAFTKIGYFTPDEINVQFITLSHQQIDDTPLLFVTFGSFVNGQRKLALTGKNRDQFLILGTVLQAVEAEVSKDTVVLFSAKREFDSDEGYEHRKGFYSTIAQAQHKRLGGSMGELDIDGGRLFYISRRSVSKLEVLAMLKSQKMISMQTVKSLFRK
jgi:hypothetical protein